MKKYCFLLFLTTVNSKVTTQSSLLGPRNFNYHAYEAKLTADPERQGPVLFPKSTASPPRTPLIVTSRPLAESIAKSDFNNSVAQSSNINRVTYTPDYNTYDYHPYAGVVKTRGSALERDNRYNDYEDRTVLPPVYKALPDRAEQRLGYSHEKNRYQVREPDNEIRYNDVNDYGHSNYNQGENYAFSYAVKDQKTGDDFSHKQRSTGSATNGEYRVRLPDGRMQIVSYTADENGYKADVRYDNDIGYNNQYHNDNEYKKTNNNKYQNIEYNNDEHLQPTTNYKQPNDYYDLSKEYNDYSLEYDEKFEKFSPHKPKFTAFAGKYNNNYGAVSQDLKPTVKPSYEELKHLFVTRKPLIPLQPSNNELVSTNNIPVEVNVPSTTSNPLDFDYTTQKVVYITKKPFYTDVKQNIPNTTPSYLTNNLVSSNVIATPNYLNNLITNSIVATPTTYQLPTVTSYNNVDLSGPKPILSDSFLNRINSYLKFK